MKKNISVLILILLIAGCKKKTEPQKINLCTSDNCTTYFQIWKKLFLNSNNMPEAYFNAHIIPFYSGISTWNSGESFNVRYTVKIDWMECSLSDQFIIKTKADETTYPTLAIKRGDYLNEDEVKLALDDFAFGSQMNVVASIEHLFYSTQKQATAEMSKKAGKTVKNQTFFYQQKNISSIPNGHPYLSGSAVISNPDNKCISATADLESGECTSVEGECWVN